MKERPILFSAPMARAILAGTKTQTRRLMSPQPTTEPIDRSEWECGPRRNPCPPYLFPFRRPDEERSHYAYACPYGVPSDRLWLRETWQYADWTEDGQPWVRYAADDSKRLCERIPDDWTDRVTKAWADLSAPENFAIDGAAADRKWRPSIFLPRWASRIDLEVTAVRVERLTAISEEDAKAEGVAPFGEAFECISLDQPFHRGDGSTFAARDAQHVASFACLWDEINGDHALWSSNPWVWVVEFRRVAAKEQA